MMNLRDLIEEDYREQLHDDVCRGFAPRRAVRYEGPMTPRGGPLLHEPGGDNTPQGKLARGCGLLLVWIVGVIITIGLAQVAEHWWKGG